MIAQVGEHSSARCAPRRASTRAGSPRQQVIYGGHQRFGETSALARCADRLAPQPADPRWQCVVIAVKASPTLANSRRCSQYSAKSSVAMSARRRHNSPKRSTSKFLAASSARGERNPKTTLIHFLLSCRTRCSRQHNRAARVALPAVFDHISSQRCLAGRRKTLNVSGVFNEMQ